MRNILLATIFFTSIFAQGQMDRRSMSDSDKMEVRKKRMEQLQNQKESTMIGVQTNYLNLSSDQAEKFFPMQNEYKDKVREVQKKYREKIGSLRSKAKDASKFDVNSAIEYQLKMKENLAKLESEFLRVNELIESQRFIDAFRLNGKLVAQAICDNESELICEDIEISVGGCSAAITGSGPAIVILCESYWSSRVIDYLENKNLKWIRTKILRDKIAMKKEL